ncbi:cuticle protein 19-like [Portunus trituberculatus]|uniref:cuticle protein 19-like n=1 Tax=Portunus trituberculatus TaxID=210409 RepID=UPI001E1CD0B2|nr:cuticle protein 19-like [Portunus trituberculatus]
MNTKVFLLLAMAALAAADFSYGRPDSHSFESYESDESSEAKYAFQWAVRDDSTGNDFDHQEARDGDDTQGVYTVHLPDGRRQTVTYVVDGDDGYVADVKYDGEARFPDSYSRESFESRSFESREYRPPRPAYFYGSNESK